MTESFDAAVNPREPLNATATDDWQAGSAEPWVADLLAALIVASHAKTVIEIGGFTGFTSKRLARALNTLRRGTLTVCELDPERAERVNAELDILRLPHVRHKVIADDSLRWLPTLADESVDFAWIDGDHEKLHVVRELELLWPKMRTGGLICGHDMYGVCDLQAVFTRAPWYGYALDLPRLGPAGGLGIIQVHA